MNKVLPAIIIVGYNRPKSLSRLLKSISEANYENDNIPLIISIDYSEGNESIIQIANDFDWPYGEKEVIRHEANLGLRKHVLSCGDLTNRFESIIMLEDDLYVSPNFYIYAVAALDFSSKKTYLAGVSLYNHPINVHTNEVFRPIEDGYDNYYFQFASSWGQAWNKNHWNDFKEWYKDNPEISSSVYIPRNVTNWSEKSWLKYFTVYLIETQKYFLYPKISLTTNFSDAGTHVGSDTTSYQATLNFAQHYNPIFSTLEESESVYDSFYENINLYQALNLKKDDLCVDLYGYKQKSNAKFWLSSQILNYTIVRSFSRSLKPLDANTIQNIEGKDLFLYDTSQQKSNPFKTNGYRRVSYNIGHLSFKNSLLITSKLLALKIKAKFGL